MSFKKTEVGRIPQEWNIDFIDNIKFNKKNAIAMGPFGSNIKKENFVDGGIPVIRGNNLTSFKLCEDEFIYLTEEKADKLKASEVNRGDIVITHRGTLGQVSYVPHNSKYEKYIVSQSGMKLSCDFEKVDPIFITYFLKSRIGQHLLLRNTSQVGVPSIATPTTSLKKIPIPIPELTEQKSIVKVLLDLDNKIEVNNKINKKLEDMAQSIFKHWFVDFEFPNEEGKGYKSSGGEMVESELGMIPKGWEVMELGEIIDIFDSKRIPLSKNKREKMEKKYPYYGAASLMDYVEDYIFDGIYVLMGEDGTVIDENGFPILQYVWGQFWVNNHAHVLKGKGKISEDFLYILLKNQNITASVTGAVQLKINQQNLKSIKLVLPKDKKLINEFSKLIKYGFNKIRNNSDETERLIKLRDTLLPKLMSGEIRVPTK